MLEYFFENLSRNIKFHYNMTRKSDTSHEDQHTVMITSRSVPPIMRNVSEKHCRKIKTQILFSKKQATWKKFVEPESLQMTKRPMRILCWITKDIDTHSEYLILTALHGSNGYTKAPEIYRVRKLPFLFI